MSFPGQTSGDIAHCQLIQLHLIEPTKSLDCALQVPSNPLEQSYAFRTGLRREVPDLHQTAYLEDAHARSVCFAEYQHTRFSDLLKHKLLLLREGHGGEAWRQLRDDARHSPPKDQLAGDR